MIDTIVLTLNYPDFHIRNPENFAPYANLLFAYSGPFMKAIYDPMHDTDVYEYLPRLTLYHRIVVGGRSITLNIEFSVPNLVYGNNFLEVTQADFELVIATLQDRLDAIGVEVARKHLASAKLSKLHYGKNFVLTDFATPYSFIQEIYQANISKQLDVDKADYRNEGHSLKYQNNTFALMFYDKIKDLEKAKISRRKSVEDRPQIHGDLQAKLKNRSGALPIEALRMEIQFNKRSRIKVELKKLGIMIEPTFQNLFSEKISREVCLSYLHSIRDSLIFSKIEHRDSPIEQYMAIQRANPTIKSQKLLEYLGFMKLVEDSDLGTARQIVAGSSSSKWQTIKNQYSALSSSRSSLEINKLITEVEKFKPITELDFYKLY